MKKNTTHFNKKKSSSKVLAILFVLFSSYFLNAQTLKSVAESKGVSIGNIMSNGFLQDYNTQGGQLNTIVSEEYNIMTAENGMKMDAILSSRPANPFNVQVSDLNTYYIDQFVGYKNLKGFKTRGHAMIWYNQAPGWLQNEVNGTSNSAPWTAQQIYDFSRTYITALATYTKDTMDEWDVLNEAITDGNANYRNAWYSRVDTQANNSNQIGYDTYFGSLFSWANAATDAKLYYNDYSIEQFGTSKNNFMRALVKRIKQSGAPMDAVGFQGHFKLNEMSDNFVSQVGQSIDDLGNANLEVAITELDIRLCGSGNDAQQKSAYKRLTKMALSKSNCNTLLVWGLTDDNSWIPGFEPGCGYATLHNGSYNKKQAYFGVLEALQELSGGNNNNNGNDDIASVTGPGSVAQGANDFGISVSYSASQNRDIVVVFQQNSSPWTTYSAETKSVGAGSGTLNFNNLEIPNNTPIANNQYQFQVFITTNGGGWNEKLDNDAKTNVNVTAASGNGQLIANGRYLMKSDSNKFIRARTSNGIDVISSSLDDVTQSYWDFSHVGSNVYEIKNVRYNNSRLVAYNGDTGNNARVGVTTWYGSDKGALRWEAVALNNNRFLFRPQHDPGRALDIYASNWTKVHLWGEDAGNSNQRFSIIPVNGSKSGAKELQSGSELSEVKLYPNPAGNQINLTMSQEFKGNISITDVLGKVVYNTVINDNITNYSIDVSTLNTGLYFLKTDLGVTKFVKK